jgi:hypothetical protein
VTLAEISTSTQHSAFSPRNILVLFGPASFPARLQKEKRSHRAGFLQGKNMNLRGDSRDRGYPG